MRKFLRTNKYRIFNHEMYKNIAITKVVLVTSMNYKTSEDDLRNFFANCGKITNIRFLYDKNDVAMGSAYVAFETHEMALKAYALDDTLLRDRFLRIALNRTDAIEEIMTKPENKQTDIMTTDQDSKKEVYTNQNNNEFKKQEMKERDESENKKRKSHKDSDKEHKHHHKHKHHKHHKHKKHHGNEESSDESTRYYTELPE